MLCVERIASLCAPSTPAALFALSPAGAWEKVAIGLVERLDAERALDGVLLFVLQGARARARAQTRARDEQAPLSQHQAQHTTTKHCPHTHTRSHAARRPVAAWPWRARRALSACAPAARAERERDGRHLVSARADSRAAGATGWGGTQARSSRRRGPNGEAPAPAAPALLSSPNRAASRALVCAQSWRARACAQEALGAMPSVEDLYSLPACLFARSHSALVFFLWAARQARAQSCLLDARNTRALQARKGDV